jgi:basic amino acid/polyamine antiporter, APA family
LMNLFKAVSRKKQINNLTEEPLDSGGHISLNKVLTTKDLTALGVAAIIGAGVFSTIGRACFNGGPAVSLLFVFTAITCALCALCYAEFASRVPIAGSAYTYAYVAFGELIAWIIGWNLIMEYAIGNITVTIAWSANFCSFLRGFGIYIPEWISTSFLAAKKAHEQYANLEAQGVSIPLHIEQLNNLWNTAPKICDSIPLIFNLPAFVCTILITALVYIGIKESRNATILMVVFKVIVVILVILVGACYINPENWQPFAPNGLTSVMQGVSAVFFAYVGFDAVSTTAEECRNPQKDLPQGMINSLLICTVLYIAIAVVLTGMVNYTKLNVADFLPFVFREVGLDWVGGILALSAIVATTSVILVFTIAQPRIWMAMSRDGLLPAKFSFIHPKFQTPSFSTLVMGFMVGIPVLFMDSELATDMNSIGTLFAFVSVCAGILFLPKNNQEGKFTVPYINGKYIMPALLAIAMMIVFVCDVAFFAKFFSLEDPKLSVYEVFMQKLPYFTFFALTIFVTIMSFVKKLSLIPVLGLLSCFYLMTELGIANWQRFIIWLLIGLVIYFVYGYKKSKLS